MRMGSARPTGTEQMVEETYKINYTKATLTHLEKQMDSATHKDSAVSMDMLPTEPQQMLIEKTYQIDYDIKATLMHLETALRFSNANGLSNAHGNGTGGARADNI